MIIIRLIDDILAVLVISFISTHDSAIAAHTRTLKLSHHFLGPLI